MTSNCRAELIAAGEAFQRDTDNMEELTHFVKKDKILHLEQNDSMKLSRLSDSSAEQEPGCPGKQQIEHGSALEVERLNHLGYKSIASRLREVFSPIYASASRIVHFWNRNIIK